MYENPLFHVREGSLSKYRLNQLPCRSSVMIFVYFFAQGVIRYTAGGTVDHILSRFYERQPLNPPLVLFVFSCQYMGWHPALPFIPLSILAE